MQFHFYFYNAGNGHVFCTCLCVCVCLHRSIRVNGMHHPSLHLMLDAFLICVFFYAGRFIHIHVHINVLHIACMHELKEACSVYVKRNRCSMCIQYFTVLLHADTSPVHA